MTTNDPVPPLVRLGLTPETGALTSWDEASGTASGATIEVLREIARRAGWRLAYVLFEGSGSNPAVAALDDGRIDVIAYTFQITPGRREQADFSSEVLAYGEALVVRADDEREYRTADDLADVRVGVIAGSNYVDIALRVGAVPVIGTSLTRAVADVDDGTIDAVIGTAPTLLHVARTGPFPKVRVVDGYRSHDAHPAGFGVKKGNAALLTAIDAQLAALRADGTLAAILARHGL